jgi:hypothetical protein
MFINFFNKLLVLKLINEELNLKKCIKILNIILFKKLYRLILLIYNKIIINILQK